MTYQLGRYRLADWNQERMEEEHPAEIRSKRNFTETRTQPRALGRKGACTRCRSSAPPLSLKFPNLPPAKTAATAYGFGSDCRDGGQRSHEPDRGSSTETEHLAPREPAPPPVNAQVLLLLCVRARRILF
jgi:hypothetical protein